MTSLPLRLLPLLLCLACPAGAAAPDDPPDGATGVAAEPSQDAASTPPPTPLRPPAAAVPLAPGTAPSRTAGNPLETLRTDCARTAREALSGGSEVDLQPCDLLVAQLDLSAQAGPGLAEALGNRALVFATGGDLDLAFDDLDRAANAAPADPVLALNRSFVLLHAGRSQDALAVLDPLIREWAGPSPAPGAATAPPPWLAAALINRALVLRSLGEDQAAAADLRQARRLAEQPTAPVSGPSASIQAPSTTSGSPAGAGSPIGPPRPQ